MTLVGKQFRITCSANDQIGNLKRKIHVKGGIPPECQNLVFEGKQLEDAPILAYYNIKSVSYAKINDVKSTVL